MSDLIARSPWWLATVGILALVEAIWRIVTRRGYDGRAALATLGLVLGSIPFALVTGAVVGAVALAVSALAPVQWPLSDWRSWLAGFLLFELAYYGFHRASHHVRWMWASHCVHHSAEELTLVASLRLGWTALFSLGWLFYLPLLLLGMPPLMVAALRALDLNYQFLLHTEAVGRLGPLEWVFNTPAHHRLHHASNAPYRDRNFGGVLIVYDRLFGTLAREVPGETPRYGLAGHPAGYNVLRLAFGEWGRMVRDARAVRGVRARISALLRQPAA